MCEHEHIVVINTAPCNLVACGWWVSTYLGSTAGMAPNMQAASQTAAPPELSTTFNNDSRPRMSEVEPVPSFSSCTRGSKPCSDTTKAARSSKRKPACFGTRAALLAPPFACCASAVLRVVPPPGEDLPSSPLPMAEEELIAFRRSKGAPVTASRATMSPRSTEDPVPTPPSTPPPSAAAEPAFSGGSDRHLSRFDEALSIASIAAAPPLDRDASLLSLTTH